MLRFLLVLVMLPTLQCVFAQAEDGVVGVWKVKSAANEIVQTKERRAIYGEHPSGYLIITPERFTAIITAEGRKAPETDADRISSFRTMFAYTGLYRIEGNRITTHVDVAWNEAWTGTDQTRIFRLEGDRLFIESLPAPSPNAPALGVIRAILEFTRDK